MVAFNEASKIELALKSVSWADEIVVLDLGSTDGTVDICERYADRVEHHSWVPFADPLRNYAMTLASNEWILLLDPDERVSEPLAERIKTIVREDWPIDMVTVEFEHIRFGKVLRRSEAKTVSRTPRLLRRTAVSWPERVHTVPDLEDIRSLHLSWADVGGGIEHDTWSTVDDLVNRLARYTEYEARDMMNDGKLYSTHETVESVWREFYRIFIVQKTYNDGVPGLYYALGMAVYRLLVRMHLWELEGRDFRHDVSVERWGHRLRTADDLLIVPLRAARRSMRKLRNLGWSMPHW